MKHGMLLTALALVVQSAAAQSISTFDTAIHQVLRQNPEIYQAFQEVEARQHQKRAASSQYRPKIELGASAGYQRYKAPSTGDQRLDHDTAGAVVRASQMLFDGFATKNEVARQAQRVESATYEAFATAENLTLRTAEVYIEVLKRNEIIRLAQQSLDLHKQIREQMQARINAGVGNEGDLAQIRARESLSQSNYIAAKSSLLNAETNFLRVVGSYPIVANMAQPAQLTSWFSGDVHKEIQSALQQHPTIKAATSDVRTAQAQYSAAKSRFMPRIDLEADYTFNQNMNGVEGDYDDAAIGIRVSYDLYQGGEHSAHKKYTAKRIEVAKGVRDNTHLQVIEAMRLSYNAYTTLLDRENYLVEHVKYALQSRDAYREQFKIGKRTLLDVLNTENEYVNAAQALASARHDKLFSQYRIVHAKGMLLTALGTSPATLIEQQ